MAKPSLIDGRAEALIRLEELVIAHLRFLLHLRRREPSLAFPRESRCARGDARDPVVELGLFACGRAFVGRALAVDRALRDLQHALERAHDRALAWVRVLDEERSFDVEELAELLAFARPLEEHRFGERRARKCVRARRRLRPHPRDVLDRAFAITEAGADERAHRVGAFDLVGGVGPEPTVVAEVDREVEIGARTRKIAASNRDERPLDHREPLYPAVVVEGRDVGERFLGLAEAPGADRSIGGVEAERGSAKPATAPVDRNRNPDRQRRGGESDGRAVRDASRDGRGEDRREDRERDRIAATADRSLTDVIPVTLHTGTWRSGGRNLLDDLERLRKPTSLGFAEDQLPVDLHVELADSTDDDVGRLPCGFRNLGRETRGARFVVSRLAIEYLDLHTGKLVPHGGRRNARRAVLVVLFLGGCGGTPPQARPVAASASATPTSSSSAKPVHAEHRPLIGPLFRRAAATMDPVDLASLAAAQGADDLAILLDDPATHDTALAAIGYADDGELAYGRLAARARVHPGDEALSAIDAIARSFERPNHRGELLDPEGVRAAIVDLDAIARAADRARNERAAALTVLRRLASRGFAVPSPLPSLGAR